MIIVITLSPDGIERGELNSLFINAFDSALVIDGLFGILTAVF